MRIYGEGRPLPLPFWLLLYAGRAVIVTHCSIYLSQYVCIPRSFSLDKGEQTSGNRKQYSAPPPKRETAFYFFVSFHPSQLALTGSVWTTMAVSIERYLTVCMGYRPNKVQHLFYTAPILLLSLLFNIPRCFELQTIIGPVNSTVVNETTGDQYNITRYTNRILLPFNC